MERSANLFGKRIELLLVHDARPSNLTLDGSCVPDRLHYIPRASFTFGSDECRPFRDAPQGLAQVPRTTYKGHLERMLVDVVLIIRRS
jgi:hypothetical protein